jgi:hypothetical protein
LMPLCGLTNSADCFGEIVFFQVIDAIRPPSVAVSNVAPSAGTAR